MSDRDGSHPDGYRRSNNPAWSRPAAVRPAIFFLKRHGVGPMSFLRLRRLDAARTELLTAEPGSTSVSEIALRYGFYELSKFSAAYKDAFG